MPETANADGVKRFDCRRLSCFPEEKETLFFGGDTVLRIKGITQCYQGKWMKYDKYLEAVNVFSRMMDGFSVMDQAIIKKKRDQKMMKKVIRDILRALVLRLDEAETPKYVHELMLFHHSSATKIQLIYDEILTGYHWLDCILKNAHIRTVNFGNIALLFCHSETITFSMADNYDLSDLECISLMEDLVLMRKCGLDITLHFRWPSFLSENTRSNLKRHFLDYPVLANDVQLQYKRQTASFTVNTLQFSSGTEQVFRERVESMVRDLLRESQPKTEVKEDKSDAATIFPELINKSKVRVTINNIVEIRQKAVYGYCFRVKRFGLLSHLPPESVLDVIVMFYAKPLKMNVVKPGNTVAEIVLICPIIGDYQHVEAQVLHSRPYCLEHVNEKGNVSVISSSDWDTFRWDEEKDYFRVKAKKKSRITIVVVFRGEKRRIILKSKPKKNVYEYTIDKLRETVRKKFKKRGLSGLFTIKLDNGAEIRTNYDVENLLFIKYDGEIHIAE